MSAFQTLSAGNISQRVAPGTTGPFGSLLAEAATAPPGPVVKGTAASSIAGTASVAIQPRRVERRDLCQVSIIGLSAHLARRLSAFLRRPVPGPTVARRREPAMDDFEQPPQMTNDPLAQLLEEAVELARRAGELTLSYFRSSSLDIEQKKDGSPVTLADRQAERLIHEELELRH